jgi:hypothetical protein
MINIPSSIIFTPVADNSQNTIVKVGTLGKYEKVCSSRAHVHQSS